MNEKYNSKTIENIHDAKSKRVRKKINQQRHKRMRNLKKNINVYITHPISMLLDYYIY